MAAPEDINSNASIQSPQGGIPDGKWHPATLSPKCASLNYLEPVSIRATWIMGKGLEGPFNHEYSYGCLSEFDRQIISGVTLEDLQATRSNFQALDQRTAIVFKDARFFDEYTMLQNCQARERTAMEVCLHMAELEVAFPEGFTTRFYTYAALAIYALTIDTLKDLSEICEEGEQAKALDEYIDQLLAMRPKEPKHRSPQSFLPNR